MINHKQISDKCIIAAANAYDDTVRLGATHERAFAHAIAAALNAWPNGWRKGSTGTFQGAVPYPALILPLKKEGE